MNPAFHIPLWQARHDRLACHHHLTRFRPGLFTRTRATDNKIASKEPTAQPGKTSCEGRVAADVSRRILIAGKTTPTDGRVAQVPWSWKVGRGVPNAPPEVFPFLSFRVPADTRGAMGTPRPTHDRMGQHALTTAAIGVRDGRLSGGRGGSAAGIRGGAGLGYSFLAAR